MAASRDSWLRFVVWASFAERPIAVAVLLGGDGSQGGRAFAFHVVRSCGQRVRLQPLRDEAVHGRKKARIDPTVHCLARCAMDLAMMAAAERHNKLIADLATESALLREAQMMGILSACAHKSDRAGMGGDL